MARKNSHGISTGSALVASRPNQWVGNIATRFRVVFGYGLILISSILLMPELKGSLQGDTKLYQEVASDLSDGKLPYRDRPLEYPPYVIPILALPQTFGSENYFAAFKLMNFCADLILKFLLLMVGLRCCNTWRALLPILCYCLAIPFMHFIYLQRYDIWPALICVGAVLFLEKGHSFLCGLAIAVGIGVKVYPAIFVVPLIVMAVRQGKGWRFATGLFLGVLPILILSFFLPWWRFAQFQAARGLQVESLYSSVIWLLQSFGLISVRWVHTRAWFELQGPYASALLPWARGIFIGTVVFSIMMSTIGAARWEKPSIGRLAELLLLPLLAFVSFNTVFSPQFMIWLLPLAGLACLQGNPWPMFVVPFAAALNPIFYPSHEYSTGLNLFQTLILLTRNLTLIILWTYLLIKSFQLAGSRKEIICAHSQREVCSGN